jgi:hypothetical protein
LRRKNPQRGTPEWKRRREERNRPVTEKILKAIYSLTPPPCRECSTGEIRETLRADSGVTLGMRSLASRLGTLRGQGLVEAREFVQRSLWALSPLGRRAIKRAGQTS